jgi:hypothetical protein
LILASAISKRESLYEESMAFSECVSGEWRHGVYERAVFTCIAFLSAKHSLSIFQKFL